MSFYSFHPLIERWFFERFESPTAPQKEGWPCIASGAHTLIAAPTGSGKTLTAFLAVIDRLLKESIAGKLEDEMRVVYVSPLRALSNDMHRNLSIPLAELNELAAAEFPDTPVSQLRAGLRTGDTTSSQRASLVRRPPHILVTTPESLFLMLTAARGREALRTVDTVIVDEIHALVRDKRGSHLALSLERLESLCNRSIQRIGISATQKPIERIAAFLTGAPSGKPQDTGFEQGDSPDCEIVDVGHARDLDLRIEVPPSELSAVCSNEQWAEVADQIVRLIESHRSTLIFVNTRRLAERVTHQLSEVLGEDQVSSHHGSLSSQTRLDTEQRLKSGELKVVVATASLELGLDVGFIDLVIQIGSPRSIATLLQRIGRSGHSLGKTPKGRLFALTRDELVECMALVKAINAGRLDEIPIPENAVDVLAQQIVGEVANQEWATDDLFQIVRRAWPYRTLGRETFDRTIEFLSEGLTDRAGRSQVYLHHDRVQKKLRSRPGARIAATSNAGAIPEIGLFRVVAEPDNTVVGTLDEDFAIESHAGQIFLLGNTSWRIHGIRGTDVVVSDAGGAPPTIPFWRGEAPGRTIELSEEVSALREDLESRVRRIPSTQVATWWEVDRPPESTAAVHSSLSESAEHPANRSDAPNGNGCETVLDLVVALASETHCSEFASEQIVRYVSAQIAALGIVPTQKRVVFERFFDESGGMQMVVHAPFGGRVTQAWGLAMRKRFCRSFDFELQATADDDGFILSLGPQHSFPLESMFPMLTRENVQVLLEQAILQIPMFQIRWRWNANRSLIVLRRNKGQKIPPNLQRFRADDLLTSVFPLLLGCQENVVGDIELPDHVLVRQTMDDCLHEALDLESLLTVMGRIEDDEIEFIARDTREPSPFAYELLNANPYAFLDGGEIQERRTRAVATRRSLSVESVNDLGRLDPDAIEQVVRQARPVVRNADEMHDVLLTRYILPDDEADEYREWLEQLVLDRRACSIEQDGRRFWVAAERLPAIQAMFPEAIADPAIAVPDGVKLDWDNVTARVATVRGLMEIAGPTNHLEVSRRTGIPSRFTFGVLEALEGEGIVLRGRFRPQTPASIPGVKNVSGDLSTASIAVDDATSKQDQRAQTEWCHRRLLARIHRLTMDGLRREIEPVSTDVYFQFLTDWHGLTVNSRRGSINGLFEVVSMLQGLDIAASAWEQDILPQRLQDYKPEWIDELCLGGDVAWSRLFPPKRDSENAATLTKVMPVSLVLREDADWLADSDQQREFSNRITPIAGLIVKALAEAGAMFVADLEKILARHESADGDVNRISVARGGRPDDLKQSVTSALAELVSLGLVTSDGFAGLRGLLASKVRDSRAVQSRTARLMRSRRSTAGSGRWSLSPLGLRVVDMVLEEASRINEGRDEEPGKPDEWEEPRGRKRIPNRIAGPNHDDWVEQWAWQLLRRWGVVFRDVLTKEQGAPRWWQLLQVYRRLEARGELRGGRFISGVAGEQFALGDSVRKLRRLRDQQGDSGSSPDQPARSVSEVIRNKLTERGPRRRRQRTQSLRESFLSSRPVSSAGVAETTQADRPSASSEDSCLVLSACDPINLIGIITDHQRVPSLPHNKIVLQNGRPIAALVNGQVLMLNDDTGKSRGELQRVLVESIEKPTAFGL